MRKTTIILAVAAFAVGGLVGAYALLAERPVERGAAAGAIHPAWSEVQWPFPMDQWGKGKAFRCKPSDCGAEVMIYIRAKIGFCNCTTGVSDDEELDRISDYDLLGNKLAALGPGRPIGVAWMKGRSRAFMVGGAQPHAKSALSVGFNDRCDAIVATAVLEHQQPAAIEPAVLEFLNSKTVVRWAEVTLGL
ncbi:MAG: hypothetical protein QOF09_52 [Alphaproteobacteria bacterium]|jgi:hypothetical protein|nr:hypothetical protein [Alphaproteobacteria bacterium]